MCREEEVEEANYDVGVFGKRCAKEWQEFFKHGRNIFRIEVNLRERTDLGECACITFDGGAGSSARFAGKYEDFDLFIQRSPI